jgi:two-component system nitrate/nitrite response regulator NarL
MILNEISLGLVDSHPLMLEGMVNLLGRKHGAKILAGSKESDVIEIASRCRPDVIITELMFGAVYRRLKFHPKKTL